MEIIAGSVHVTTTETHTVRRAYFVESIQIGSVTEFGTVTATEQALNPAQNHALTPELIEQFTESIETEDMAASQELKSELRYERIVRRVAIGVMTAVGLYGASINESESINQGVEPSTFTLGGVTLVCIGLTWGMFRGSTRDKQARFEEKQAERNRKRAILRSLQPISGASES